MAAVLAAQNARPAAETLLGLALDRGGYDNITILLAMSEPC